MTDPAAPATEDLRTAVDAGVLTVTFARPRQRNAMTWAMYEALRAACRRAADPDVAVVVLRGEGGRAFVAGTDIAQFAAFATGDDGVDYERGVAAVLEDLLAVEVPVLAVVDGFCVGAGLAIAACADLVVASEGSSFGVPVARTLGNTLSAHSLALLGERFGPGRVTEMLLTARLVPAAEARDAGFVARLVADPADLDATVDALVTTLRAHAPTTLWATKELRRRLRPAREVDDADVVARAYGSADFREGVAAFVERRAPVWTGR